MIRRLTADKHWFIDPVQQWSQIWEDCNWYDFDLVWIRFENDKIMGGYEATFIIAGLGFRWRWNHTRTEQMQECLDAMESIKAGDVNHPDWGKVTDETAEALAGEKPDVVH